MRKLLKISMSICCVAWLSSCVTPPSSPTQDFRDGKYYFLSKPYAWPIGKSGDIITIPSGFVTDLASIPWWARGILTSTDIYKRAAIFHDYLYWTQSCSREQSDRILAVAMKELDVESWKREVVFGAVYWGGQDAWDDNAAQRLAGKPRFLPKRYFRLPDRHGWKQAQQILIDAGIRPEAPLPKNLAYCKHGDTTDVPKRVEPPRVTMLTRGRQG